MKQLLVAGLLTLVAIALDSNGVNAQAVLQTTAPKTQATTSLSTQNLPLVTQPASLSRMPFRSGQSFAPYTADQLNSIVGPLEAHSRVKTPSSQGSVDSLIQKLSTSDPKPASVDPIDFFKPQSLNSGVKVPLQ